MKKKKKIPGKYLNIWKFKSTLLNSLWVKEEIMKQTKCLNDKRNTMQSSLGIRGGLVPGPTSDTKVHGCSSPVVSPRSCVCRYNQSDRVLQQCVWGRGWESESEWTHPVQVCSNWKGKS